MKETRWEVEDPSGRFNARPAIAITVGEEIWGRGPSPQEALHEAEADWLLVEEQPELGRAEAIEGSTGRGASGWAVVVQWLGEAIANNVVDIALGYALATVIGRLRDWRNRRNNEGTYGGFLVSRGAAAVLAGAHAAEAFKEEGPIEVEAVEEPSSIAGHEITETSYVGLEPWVVLLRNVEMKIRYVVVVMPDGEVSGALCVPFLPYEEGYLPPSRFSEREE